MSLIYLLVFCFSVVNSDIYNVQIATESHVNLVDRRFLSFSVDPKLLFSSIGKYSKECTCMASALTPAYLRVAGPSTSRLSFTNSTLTVATDRPPSVFQREASQIGVRPKQWEKFVKWAKTTGFDMVFALNSDQKTGAGMWDPNSALSILTAADAAGITDIFWQLGYECKNQSIEEYLSDLETLRVIIETFSRSEWKVVGGDVTDCLHADSKSDFKDYVTLSNDMMDAILLNGNSSSQELERMSEKDRMRLLKLLTKSDVPLWLTERSRVDAELARAAEWLASLGFSARNGFAVHYRDLLEEELYEPTLSFYMALLFKNLVGERVLDVDMDVSKATLFAHCTSLHHKPVPGALTLYGANMDDEPARFSLKLSKKEEGGDIMQFILGHDENGNIVVNSHAMYYEGDIRPVVKRVRPYKTLLINLPPKSFGFWVLANTQVMACREFDTKKLEDSNEVVALSQEEPNVVKVKRSVINYDNIECIDEEYMDGAENDILDDKNRALLDRVVNINRDLKKMQSIFQNKFNNDALIRLRRQVFNNNERYKLHESKLKERINELSLSSNLIRKLLDITNINMTCPFRNDLSRKRMSKIKNTRRNKSDIEPRDIKSKKGKSYDKKVSKYDIKIKTDSNPNFGREMGVRNKNINHDITSLQAIDSSEVKSRKRRSIQDKSISKQREVFSSENAIDSDSKEKLKFSKILRKIKKISNLPLGIAVKTDNDDYEDVENDDLNAIVLKTQLEDDGAVIKISENPKIGILTSTFEDLLSLLSGLNKKLIKVWDMANFLE